jgi:uncharacterized membrane protein YdjX (TVP38/TMEM64 family)
VKHSVARILLIVLLGTLALAVLAVFPVHLRYDPGFFVTARAGDTSVELFASGEGAPREVFVPDDAPKARALLAAREIALPGGARVTIAAAPPSAPRGVASLVEGVRGIPPSAMREVRYFHSGGKATAELRVVSAIFEHGGIRTLAEAFRDALSGLGPWGVGAFILAYAVGALIAFPSTVLTLAAALAFGFWKALFLVYAGVNAGALTTFLVGRYLLRDFVDRHLPRRLWALDERLSARGFGTVVVLRLLPVAPFLLVNYTSAVSHIRPRDYIAGTALGVIPITMLWVYALHTVGRLSPTDPWFWARFLLLIPFFVAWWLARRRRIATAERPLASPRPR